MKNISVRNITYLIGLVFVLKLVTIFLHPLHHPSEARYAAISMRMALTENYLMPFFDPVTPFFGKPPLSFWASAISLEIFGINEFAGRLPHYLALILTCLVLYRAVKKTFDEKTAIASVVIICSTFLFYALHSIMTEAFLLLGMTMITTSFLPTMRGEQKDSLIFFLGCVIAMLTKGPVGIVMPCLAIPIYLTMTREWGKFFQNFPIICGSIFFIAATLPWFLLAEKNYSGFLEYFFLGENFGRFMKSGWEGDRYGNAHHVPFGMIWFYFTLTMLPPLLALVIKPKQITKTFFKELKADKDFLFFTTSLLAPLFLLTFMSNMIPTYPVYSLTSFAVILARILTQIKWDKFIYFLCYLTIVFYGILIVTFAIKPEFLLEKLNSQAYILSKIPQKEFQLYQIGEGKSIFTLYWATEDKVKIVTKEKFFETIDRKNPLPIYAIGGGYIYDQFSPQEKSQLKIIFCTKKRRNCLYELIS
ncbi:MAG: glycosyltransferase family 39 protein [Proteobacteria bacterium]|nr:glycosyltransferase family 39 protein [Pseudomonadota bacterium]